MYCCVRTLHKCCWTLNTATRVILLSINFALAVMYNKWSKDISASLVSCHVGCHQWAWGSSRAKEGRRRRLKDWPRRNAALATWRRFGWTDLQLSPGSALLELAYLAGKPHNTEVTVADSYCHKRIPITGHCHVVLRVEVSRM